MKKRLSVDDNRSDEFVESPIGLIVCNCSLIGVFFIAAVCETARFEVKIAEKHLHFRMPSPLQNGHATVTPPNGAQLFKRSRGVPRGSRSVGAFFNRRFSLLLFAKL
jgi:hypothetical protein